jgi:hypothetical protein
MIVCLLFFLNSKYIIIRNQISAQDEQRSVEEKLQDKGAVYRRNTSEKYQNRHFLTEVQLQSHS